MANENGARTRAECVHAWESVDSVGRRCRKCQLLWETWAEERLMELEERLSSMEMRVDDDDDDDSDESVDGGEGDIMIDESALVFVTMLPPQTEYTCPSCHGTGGAPLFEFALCCMVCGCAYTPQYVSTLTEASILPCGHGARMIVAMNHCLDCGGTGQIR